MKKLMVYMKEYRKQAVLAPLFKLLEALMDLLTPLVVAAILNRGVAARNSGFVVRCFILLLVLAVAGMLFSFTAQWFAAKASVGWATKIRQALFDHIQSLSYTELDTLGTDTLITRMTSDVNQIQSGMNLALRLLLRSPFIVFGAMIMAFTIDVRSALIFVVAIPLLSLVVFGIMIKSIPLYAKAQAALDKLLGITRENLTGVRVIRAFCKEDQEIDEFDRRNEALTKMNEFVGKLSALMNPATYLIIQIATIVLIYVGAIRVNVGGIAQGDVVALYNYMAQIVIELIKLASLIITINKSIACADRIENILEVQPGMTYPEAGGAQTAGSDLTGATDRGICDSHGHHTQASENIAAETGGAQTAGNNLAGATDRGIHDSHGFHTRASGTGAGRNDAQPSNAAADTACVPDAVVFNHVSFSYEGSGEDAITDIDFTVKRGQTVGIIGGTGSGKSTVVNLIPRFYDASKGAVLVNGVNVKDYPQGELISKIGVVPQKAVLFEGTIRDNLRWGNEDATDEQMWKAIDTAQAREVVEGKDGQLDAIIEQNGRNLSGGQRQRLTIARALVKNPEILIMDDSASALDFATDLKLRRAVHAMEGNMTVFIVSQRTSSVRSADLILVLNDGALAGKGTHEELMKTCEVYQEIYYSQFPEERPENRKGKTDGAAAKSGSENNDKSTEGRENRENQIGGSVKTRNGGNAVKPGRSTGRPDGAAAESDSGGNNAKRAGSEAKKKNAGAKRQAERNISEKKNGKEAQ